MLVSTYIGVFLGRRKTLRCLLFFARLG